MKDLFVMDEVHGKISLSKPSKMPGYSWSLPAGKTCPAAKLTIKEFGPNAICSGCYAKDGMYRTGNVKNAQSRRLSWLVASLREDGGSKAVEVLTDLVRRAAEASEPLFRVHDSGDLFSEQYIRVWHRVAEALPHVRFWIPTREWLRPSQFEALEQLAALPNVALRPSAMAFGHEAPTVLPTAGTAVAAEDLPGHVTCPSTTAPKGQASCEQQGCRACWTKSIRIVYRAHGSKAVKAADRARRALPVLN